MTQTQFGHQFRRALFSLPKDIQQASYLIARLVACLIALNIGHGIAQGCEHKLHKGRCFSLSVGTAEAVIIFGLPIADNGFHRQVGEEGIPFAEDKRLPKTPHSAIPVRKRMDEFKFVVKDTT